MVYLYDLQSELGFILVVTCFSYNCPTPSYLLKTSPSPASIACPTGTCTDSLCCDSAFFAVISSFIFFSMPPFRFSLMCVSCPFLFFCIYFLAPASPVAQHRAVQRNGTQRICIPFPISLLSQDVPPLPRFHHRFFNARRGLKTCSVGWMNGGSVTLGRSKLLEWLCWWLWALKWTQADSSTADRLTLHSYDRLFRVSRNCGFAEQLQVERRKQKSPFRLIKPPGHFGPSKVYEDGLFWPSHSTFYPEESWGGPVDGHLRNSVAVQTITMVFTHELFVFSTFCIGPNWTL